MVTTKEVNAAIKVAAIKAGCGDGNFTSHSFRRKLATGAGRDGARAAYARRMGKWSENSVMPQTVYDKTAVRYETGDALTKLALRSARVMELV